MPKNPNWTKMKAEYIKGGISYKKLAEKYGVSFSTLCHVARREKWTDLKTKTSQKVATKLANKIADKEVKKQEAVYELADMLAEAIKKGIDNGTYTVDASSTRQIMSAIKDLKDIKNIKSERDIREQEARIDKLRKEASIEETKSEVKVIIDSGLERYAD